MNREDPGCKHEWAFKSLGRSATAGSDKALEREDEAGCFRYAAVHAANLNLVSRIEVRETRRAPTLPRLLSTGYQPEILIRKFDRTTAADSRN